MAKITHPTACLRAYEAGYELRHDCMACPVRYCSVLGRIVAGETARELGKRESDYNGLHTRLDRQFPAMGWRA